METVSVRGNNQPQSWSYIYPVQGSNTSGFGYQEWRGRVHKGVDLAVPIGTPVLAARDGEVTYVGWDEGGYGNWIEVTHPDGHSTRYGHLDSSDVQVGARVRRGQVIAKSGNTGASTGPHVHFEIRLANGEADNPVNWLPPDPAWKPSTTGTTTDKPRTPIIPEPKPDTLDPTDGIAAVSGYILTQRALEIIGNIPRQARQIGEMLVSQDKLPKPVVDRARRLAPKISEDVVRRVRGLGEFTKYLKMIGVPIALAIALVLVTAEPTGDDSVFVRTPTDKDEDEDEDKKPKGRNRAPASGVMYYPKGRLFTRNFKR